jgi:cytoskeletal protein CcmA (bactofilin family)/transcription elongation factor Elf1
MPAKKQGTVKVACPHCGHQQAEPGSGYSTNCKKCGQYYRVQEALKPARRAAEQGPEQRRLNCLDCGGEILVPVSAQSSMCKHCSSYLDLRDYLITSAVSKNFKTTGTFVVEPKGYVFNTECVVGAAVIRGRFLGKLVVERTLTIHATADIKGTFTAGCLVIPVGEHFRWPEPIKARSADIAGELAASLHAQETVTLRSTARLFGDVEARQLIIEAGAVIVGNLRIGEKIVRPWPVPEPKPPRETGPRKQTVAKRKTIRKATTRGG